MRILWSNVITMWLSQIAGFTFLLVVGWHPFIAALASGLVVGFSFGVCGVELTEDIEK